MYVTVVMEVYVTVTQVAPGRCSVPPAYHCIAASNRPKRHQECVQFFLHIIV